jgi:hypothetical protein
MDVSKLLTYVAFGALVMGGVPLRDLPDWGGANTEVALPKQKIKQKHHFHWSGLVAKKHCPA